MGKTDEFIEFEGVLEGSSGAAWKFIADGWDNAEWIPKSQSEMEPDLNSDTHGRCTMKIKEWLVRKNQWAY